ncbi:hypothetical protein [Mesorhizobium amorphae]|uniref:hypothetical protein n=1 Tax=Mesorhizobium amorphae TaxID=71433 RepID=UPI0031F4E3A5
MRPYAAEDYPDFFADPDSTVTVLSAQRTFWEKATAPCRPMRGWRSLLASTGPASLAKGW